MWRGHLKPLATRISETENELELFLQRSGQLQPVTLMATPRENEDMDSEPNGGRLLTRVMLLLFPTAVVVEGRCGCARYKHLWVKSSRLLPENKMLFLGSLACVCLGL